MLLFSLGSFGAYDLISSLQLQDLWILWIRCCIKRFIGIVPGTLCIFYHWSEDQSARDVYIPILFLKFNFSIIHNAGERLFFHISRNTIAFAFLSPSRSKIYVDRQNIVHKPLRFLIARSRTGDVKESWIPDHRSGQTDTRAIKIIKAITRRIMVLLLDKISRNNMIGCFFFGFGFIRQSDAMTCSTSLAM